MRSTDLTPKVNTLSPFLYDNNRDFVLRATVSLEREQLVKCNKVQHVAK